MVQSGRVPAADARVPGEISAGHPTTVRAWANSTSRSSNASPITERVNLQFRAECFNIENRANFGTPNATVFSNGAISPTAGLITTTVTSSRQMQFGLKLIF